MTVVTATKEFKVQKAVLCSASPFFYAAFATDFQVWDAQIKPTQWTNKRQEAHTGRITLEENETVIHSLLQQMYGVDADLLPEGFPEPWEKDAHSKFVEDVAMLKMAEAKVCAHARKRLRS